MDNFSMFKKMVVIVAFVSAYSCLEASGDGAEKLQPVIDGIRGAYFSENAQSAIVSLFYTYDRNYDYCYHHDKRNNVYQFYAQDLREHLEGCRLANFPAFTNISEQEFNKNKAVAQAWIAAQK